MSPDLHDPPAAAGDPASADELFPLVYDDLRRLARRHLDGAPPGQTLQPTALVHEAYLRLSGDQRFAHRGHFFAAAAEAMRRVLVDAARRKTRVKRGGELARVPLDPDFLASPERAGVLLALDEALNDLAAADPDAARLVSLRYFAGLTVDEAAAALDVSPRTAAYTWAYARAWLRDRLGDDSTAE